MRKTACSSKVFEKNVVKPPRRINIGTERFFDNHPCFPGAPGFAELVHNKPEQDRRNGQIVRRADR